MTTASRQHEGSAHIWISQPQGRSNCYSHPDGRFAIIATGEADVNEILRMDAYSASTAFVDGNVSISGDLFSAIRYFLDQPHHTWRDWLFSALAHLEHFRVASLSGARQESARNIQFHYDLSNDFYALFLDSRMVYSAAHFAYPERSLGEAQTEKLDRICRSLDLRPEDRFLDIGCGWGGLVSYAAEHFGVRALGCTLSQQQLEFARDMARRRGISDRVDIEPCDYRDLTGRFDKIASVGMFEHVGRNRLPGYFKKAHSLLREGGRFLNRGVVRPQGVSDGPQTLFLQKRVFPGGELVHLDDVLREGERAGFEAIALEDLRRHYAMTCRAWVKNLQNNAEKCRFLVGERNYRTWLLYLAASAVGFEDGRTSAGEIVFARS